MKTKTKFLLSIAFFFIIMLSSKVYAGTTGSLTYTIDTSNKTATITKCATSATTVNIPSKVESNYTVTSIAGGAFSGCTNLKSITIPSSILDIDCNFMDCKNLTTVTNNAKITSLRPYMFSGCSKLTTVNIPKGVTKIYHNVFENCTSLKNIEIPNTVKSINDAIFRGCTSLANVKMYDSVTDIGWYAFENCTSLKSITLSKNINSIPRGAFEGCTNLNSITLPSTVKYISESAFENCTSLTSLTVNSGAEYVYINAFEGCKNLTQLVIPRSVGGMYGSKPENISSNFKLYVESDSKAYEWAVNNNVNYVVITSSQVKNLRATSQTTNAIKYQWNAVSGATGYKVYTYNYSTGKWEYYGKTTTTAMIIKSLNPATIYKIKVRAYKNIEGIQYFGNYSTAVRTATKPANSKITSVASGNKTATIKWRQISGTTGYKIYMSTSENGTYTKMATVSSSYIKYTQTGLKSGKTYYFKVRAYKTVDGVQIFGAYSPTVAITVK